MRAISRRGPVFVQEGGETSDVVVRLLPIFRRLLRIGMDQVQPETPEKELADEAWLRPVFLARGFSDVACLLFGGEFLIGVGHYVARGVEMIRVHLPGVAPARGT